VPGERVGQCRAAGGVHSSHPPQVGAGPAVFGLICVRTGYPAAFALTGALILAVVPAALRERKAAASAARLARPRLELVPPRAATAGD
jgi:hypothetical protein